MLKDSLGDWLEWQRRKTKFWFYLLIVFMAVLVLLNFKFGPHPPHFGYDGIPGFWLVFGFGVAVIMTVILKKGVAIILGKSEDFYDRD